jgi:hypothetical protein
MYELHDIHTLSLKVFEVCTVSKGENLSPLVKSGAVEEVPEDELKKAWLGVNSSYVEIIGDTETKAYVSETDRMQVIVYRIAVYTHSVETLRMWHYERIAQALRDEFGVDLDKANPEQYAEDLDMVITLLKSDEIELAQLQAIQEARGGEIDKEQAAGVKVGYFAEMVLLIYKTLFNQPAMNIPKIMDEMKVFEYAHYMRDLKNKVTKPKPAIAE